MTLPSIAFTDLPWLVAHASICWSLEQVQEAWRNEGWPHSKRVTALDILGMEHVPEVECMRAACHLLPPGLLGWHEANAFHYDITAFSVVEPRHHPSYVTDEPKFFRTYNHLRKALATCS